MTLQEEGRVAYEQLTLRSSDNGSPVLKELSIAIPFGTRVLLPGANQAARVMLFRATAGLSAAGEGRIIRPGADAILFLAEQPYLPPGTLRQVLVRPLYEHDIADERIVGLLRELHLEPVLARAGGLDREQDWETLLSLREQQLLAFLHILLAAPRCTFLDWASTTLHPDQVQKILHMLSAYGLLPESMSHEGYMAHPAHAYWDDFWALRGLKDAVSMAEVLGHRAQAHRLRALRDAFSDTLYASLHATMQARNLDFLPGSVEFADFDPTASAIALTLVDELHHLPRAATEHTFDTYLAGFRQRGRGDIPWNNYSAYEMRIIGALVRLGRRQDAHALLDFFLADRRLLPWNQWPEISWHDPKGPSFIGDMPHSWISAEYILAVRSLFAYEREADHALVLAAGIPEHWLTDSGAVVIKDLPTYYGKLSYTLQMEGSEALRLTVSGDLALPPGRLVVKPPLPRPLVQVEVNGSQSETFDAESVTCGVCPAEMVMRY